MPHKIVTAKGKRFVMVPVAEWRRLEHLMTKAATPTPKLPARPKADQDGNVPALAYIQVSIARDLLRERTTLGLTQQQLAKLAGVREETLSRLESGKHSPTVRTIEKIERALQEAKRRERQEDAADIRAARKAMKEKAGTPLAQVKARLGTEPILSNRRSPSL